ncbi:MAG: response regulator transcription factor [Actinomycetota bacterium]|nr:response regulator [Actinomycetota bacterium]
MKVKVMVVDDTDHVREMLANMLELDGFDVVDTAASGPEAIERVGKASPHVIILDYKMPGMDGLTTTKHIRAVAPDLPIILYTAYLDEDLLEKAGRAGVSLCVGKPEGIAALERQISALSLELAEVDIR